MNIDEKRIYLVLSPHINYYHSYRGDSRGITGFGRDIKLMGAILDKLDEIEDIGFSFGNMKITWDYADTFWSIQLQREYQQDVLDRVIERCKQGKDEVLIGSWGNVAQPILDTEEFLQQHEWFLNNSMEMGVNQLFPGRVAPYARTQETMFTQGMIELYNKIGIEGFLLYYSVYPFDVGRALLYPRLNANQRYGLVKFNSSISDASMLMIPMYGFGDVIDYFSMKRWLILIRKMQETDEITGDALFVLNYDMDYDDWIGHKLPKFIQWLPKTRGLTEFAEAVDQLKYVEFANLSTIIPKLEVHGETTLYPDAADGNWNGFYNWAQKYDNTKFWTIGQRARWTKCISDTLMENNLIENKKAEINKLIRHRDDNFESYIKNKSLFASTTNFGMSVPFQHPHRTKTAISYGLKAQDAAKKAFKLAIEELLSNINQKEKSSKKTITVLPITNRGISTEENTQIKEQLFIRMPITEEIQNNFRINNNYILKSEKLILKAYSDEDQKKLFLEGFVSPDAFSDHNLFMTQMDLLNENQKTKTLKADKNLITNGIITLSINERGEINSFQFKNKEYATTKFLDSAVTFGKIGKGKRFSPKLNEVIVLRDGNDGFSASIKIKSEIEIIKGSKIYTEKILTVYSGVPSIFLDINMNLCDIRGDSVVMDGTCFVQEEHDNRWQEIIPCEIRPDLIGVENPLRVWKKNFFGRVSYFDINMQDIDKRNSDIDCLVSNISDGWMALSDKSKGLLLGFNSLEAANFAFSPLKVRSKGFGDASKKGQQVRINPFGTYYGDLLRYWTMGSGHAEKITRKFLGTIHSTAPTYSGKELKFNLILMPYIGDKPPESIQSIADHFSLPPLIILNDQEQGKTFMNASKYFHIAEKLKKEYEVEKLMQMPYLEWVKEVNKDFDPNIPEDVKEVSIISKLGIWNMILQLIDGIRGR